MPGLHVHSNLGLHVFSFSCVYHSPQVLNSNLANLVHLSLFFQKSTSQVTGEVSQLKNEMASSKATFEQRIKDLEASLEKATSENAELKKSMKTQEEEWKTRLATAESKFGERSEERRVGKECRL